MLPRTVKETDIFKLFVSHFEIGADWCLRLFAEIMKHPLRHYIGEPKIELIGSKSAILDKFCAECTNLYIWPQKVHQQAYVSQIKIFWATSACWIFKALSAAYLEMTRRKLAIPCNEPAVMFAVAARNSLFSPLSLYSFVAFQNWFDVCALGLALISNVHHSLDKISFIFEWKCVNFTSQQRLDIFISCPEIPSSFC